MICTISLRLKKNYSGLIKEIVKMTTQHKSKEKCFC